MNTLQLAFLVSVLVLTGCGGSGGGASDNSGGASSGASSVSSQSSAASSSANAAEVALGASNLPPDSGVANAGVLSDDELSPENKTVALAADEIAPL